MDVETQQQHAAIRETVRRFAQDQLLPNALRWDREREFPRQALQELGTMGLFGVTIPEKWGGAELDNTDSPSRSKKLPREIARPL